MTRTMPRLRILLTACALLALALVPTALAGKGGKPAPGGGGSTSGSSVEMVPMAPDGVTNWGDQVTFKVSTSATTQPMVRLDCYQGGVKVYWASAGFYDGYPWAWARNFTLKSTYWTGGAANCTATLYLNDGRRYRDLASTSFPVAA